MSCSRTASSSLDRQIQDLLLSFDVVVLIKIIKMVSRKTRLKGGSHVSTEKGAHVQKVSVGFKTTSKIKTAKMAKSKENKKLIKTSDAYIFDETDDFISGSSILSPPSSSNTATTTKSSSSNTATTTKSSSSNTATTTKSSSSKTATTTKSSSSKTATTTKSSSSNTATTTKSSIGKREREQGVQKVSFVEPRSKTDNVKRCKYSKQLKLNNFKSENGSSKTQQKVLIKKTSTPLASLTPTNPDNKQNNCLLDCRIIIPKLNLDLTVTPILPICTPPLTELSSQCSKSVSFSDIPRLKQTDSRETPKHPDMKPVTKSTGIKDKELFGAEADVRDLKLKRKYSRMFAKSPTQNTQKDPRLRSGRVKLTRKDTNHQNKLDTNVSSSVAAKTPTLPKGKTESLCISSVLHEQKGVPKIQVDILGQKSVPKDTPTDLPSHKTTKKEKTPPHRQKPDRTKKAAVSRRVLSNKAQTECILGKTETISGKTRVREPGHEEGCTSKLLDSGISLGEDVSHCDGKTSTICSLLPGFMEEPLQSELQVFLADAPVSSPVISTNVSDPASSLNKSLTSDGYKRGSAKREKGRYSTSKVEAWASAISQSLEELESFELLVE